MRKNKKKGMKKSIAIVLSSFFVLSGVLTGCGQKDNETQTDGTTDKKTGEVEDYDGLTVRFGESQAKFIDLAFYLGYFDEEFADKGINYEIQQYSNGPAFLDAVAIDETDIGSFGIQPTIAAVANGVNVHTIANYGDTSKNIWVVANPDSGIDTVEDLKGKVIAVSPGTTMQYHLQQIAKYYGWTEGVDFEATYISEYAEIITAVGTGAVDAAIILSTNAYSALNDGSIKKVDDVSKFSKELTIIVVSDTFSEKYPEVVTGLLEVFDKTYKYVRENPEEAAKLLSEKSGVEYEGLLEYLESADLRLNITDEDIDTYNAMADFQYEQNTITEKVTDDQWVDTKFLQEAGIQ